MKLFINAINNWHPKKNKMKGQMKFILLPLISWGIILCFIWYFYSGMSYTLEGVIGKSSTINESKYRKVFVSNYEIIPNPIIINDRIKIKVKNFF